MDEADFVIEEEPVRSRGNLRDKLYKHIEETQRENLVPGGSVTVRLTEPDHTYVLTEKPRHALAEVRWAAISAANNAYVLDGATKDVDAEGGNPETRDKRIKQRIVARSSNPETYPLPKFYDLIVDLEVAPGIVEKRSLRSLDYEDDGRLVCCECTIMGLEPVMAFPVSYKLRDGTTVSAASHSPDKENPIQRRNVESMQFLFVEELNPEPHRTPVRMGMRLYNKFAGAYEIGDKIRTFGTLQAEHKKSKGEEQPLRFYLAASWVEKMREEKKHMLTDKEADATRKEIKALGTEKFLDQMTESFAPQIYGNELAKRLCLLVALGGIQTRTHRPQIHGYLVGPPSTGKSALLAAAAKLRSDTIYTDGPNASARGLVYAQETYLGHQVLKAGLLVRYGMVMLDEMEKMYKQHRAEIVSLIERQVATYNKSGFDMETPTSVSLLAAGNPKYSQWDEALPVLDNLKPIRQELLSRMMVVRLYKLKDPERQLTPIADEFSQSPELTPTYVADRLADHVGYARTLTPRLTKPAISRATEWFTQFQKLEQDAGSLPVDTRQTVDMFQLSCAFAKLLLRTEVDIECVELAIRFFSSCMETLGVITSEGPRQYSMSMVDSTKDQAFWQIAERLAGPKGFVEDEIIDQMSALHHWTTRQDAKTHWEKACRAGQFIEYETGRYKRA